jgi:hypothetical protein
MKLRKLRIAWSVVCSVAIVLLVALWVRSYSQSYYAWIDIDDQHSACTSRTIMLSTKVAAIRIWSHPGFVWPHAYGWQFSIQPTNQQPATTEYGFEWRTSPTEYAGQIPFWFLLLLATTFASFPWIRQQRWRFSLRTLLFATALLAAVLGLIVYAVR